MIRGAFHGGDRGLAQSGALRPVPGWGQHRMPIEGLYQTGGTTHPGGSITGAPGRNAAAVILADRDRGLGRPRRARNSKGSRAMTPRDRRARARDRAEITRNGHPAEDWRPRVRREGGRTVVELGGREIRSMVDEMVDIETLLATQLARGVDGVVLCPFVPLLFADAEPDACLERCRIQNRRLGPLLRGRPGPDLGARGGPAPGPGAGGRRAARAPGREGSSPASRSRRACAGPTSATPASNRSGRRRREAARCLHPPDDPRRSSESVFGGHYLWNTVGNPLETTIAAAQMTMAGRARAAPGPARPARPRRWGAARAPRPARHAHDFQPDARADCASRRSTRSGAFTSTPSPTTRELLRALIAWAGADRVLLGSDYPFDMADPDPVGSVRALGLAPEEERMVLAENAARLIRGSRRPCLTRASSRRSTTGRRG